MGIVTKGLTLPVVQIGLKTDLYCPGAIDLRGILSINETAWVMRECLAAIVIDSFPSHLAGIFNKPTIVLYGPAPARVVKPYRTVKESLWHDLEPNKLDVCPNCGSCYGRRDCTSPCINSISPFEIREILISMLQELLP
jgi:ADP-heptose:LPS heptosyltransferase